MVLPALVIDTEAIHNIQQRIKNMEAELEKLKKSMRAALGSGASPTTDASQLTSGQLADARFLNALLLDGSRSMTGAINVGEIPKGVTFGSAGAYIQGETYGGAHVIRIVSEDELFLDGNIRMNQLILTSYLQFSSGSEAGRRLYADAGLSFYGANDAGDWMKVAEIKGGYLTGFEGFMDVSRAGDITMLSGKVLNNLAGVFRLPNSASASPSTNDCYFNASTNTLYVYNGTAWKSVVLT